MDWKQIEKDFIEYLTKGDTSESAESIFNWIKQRIESELPPSKLSEEEKNEFHTTNFTVDNIKVVYDKQT